MSQKKTLSTVATVLIICLIIGLKLFFGQNDDEATDNQNTTKQELITAAAQTTAKTEDTLTTKETASLAQTQKQTASTKKEASYKFRTSEQAKSHFEKHGQEFPYKTLEAYVEGANKVINSKEALTKTEKEDGDYVYYIEKTNEFVILSKDGYIRTYFKPSAGKAYYDRQ